MIFVPHNLCLTTKFILEDSEIGKEIEQSKVLENLYHPLLAIFSLFYLSESAKKDNSFFKKYFDSLPSTEEFPIFFNEEEKFALKGSPFFEVI